MFLGNASEKVISSYDLIV